MDCHKHLQPEHQKGRVFMFTDTETFTVIHSYGEKTEQYIKDTLGKGGCNTFPEYLGICECGRRIRSNCKTLSCPSCGKQVTLSTDESYSTWSFNHPRRQTVTLRPRQRESSLRLGRFLFCFIQNSKDLISLEQWRYFFNIPYIESPNSYPFQIQQNRSYPEIFAEMMGYGADISSAGTFDFYFCCLKFSAI